MILNSGELADRMFVFKDGRHLSITPPPDQEQFRNEAGASVDLRLGRWFRTMRQAKLPLLDLTAPSAHSSFSREHFVPFDDFFILHPGSFALGITLEWMSVPFDLAANVTGKSSLGRRGLIIETAAGIHPGFAGCLTLELANVGEIPLGLKPGMSICQVVFQSIIGSGSKTSSQFHGARKPHLGKIS